MEPIHLHEILLIGALFQAAVAGNNYTEFLISSTCSPTSELGSLAEETIDCGPDGVIDIIWARVALLGRSTLCDSSFEDVVPDIIKDKSPYCTTDLPFLVCQGNQNCVVDRSMANTSLPECKLLQQIGHHSDILYVRYKCATLENRIQLQSNQVVTGSVINILNPDTSSTQAQDFICTLSPKMGTQNVYLKMAIKLANYPPRMTSLVSVEMKQPSKGIVELIPFDGMFQLRNEIFQESGKEWILRYHGDAELEIGKFWIQIQDGEQLFKSVTPVTKVACGCTDQHFAVSRGTLHDHATRTNTRGFVPLEVVCRNNMTSTTKAAKSEQKEKSLDKYLIIGLSAGGALLLIILIIIIVTVSCRRRKRRNDSERSKLSAEPSPTPTVNVGVYATASAIDEEPNQNKKSQQQNRYVNASPDNLYSAEDKDRKSDKGNNTTMFVDKTEAKNVNDDETMMFENNTLYSSTSGKDAGDVGGMEQTGK